MLQILPTVNATKDRINPMTTYRENDTPLISIVICTYNNADSLLATLESLINQNDYNTAQTELLIVDNNSNDNTRETAQEIMPRIACKTRYIFEAQQGLSNARNAGIKNAAGEYILFTDDDADLPCDWLQKYTHQITLHKPDCLFSKIKVIWDQPKPWWYLPEHAPHFCVLDHGDKPIMVTSLAHEFFGKNFCLRKTILEEQGGFDPKLGRSGNNLVAGEETLIFRRLVRENKKIIYFPDASVGHRLKPREYDVANIEKAYRDSAYASIHFARLFSTKRLFGRPIGIALSAIKAIVSAYFKLASNKLSSNKPKSLLQKLIIKKNMKIIQLWIQIKS